MIVVIQMVEGTKFYKCGAENKTLKGSQDKLESRRESRQERKFRPEQSRLLFRKWTIIKNKLILLIKIIHTIAWWCQNKRQQGQYQIQRPLSEIVAIFKLMNSACSSSQMLAFL